MYVEPTIPTLTSFQVSLLDGKQPRILAELASQETVALSFTTSSLGRVAAAVFDSESQTNNRILLGLWQQ